MPCWKFKAYRVGWTAHGILFLSLLLNACATIQPASPAVERFWPLPPDPPVISYLNSFSEPKDLGVRRNWFGRAIAFLFGEGEAPHMVRPYAVAADSGGRVYVTDTGLQVVHAFDFSRKRYYQIYWVVPGASRMISPVGVTLDDDGNIYVSDSMLNRIFVYEPRKNRPTKVIGTLGQFQRLTGIAYDAASGRLYAVDTSENKVTVFDRDGKVLNTFGRRGKEEGELNFPTHIAVGPEGLVYITDSLNFRVQIFDGDGGFKGTIGRLGKTLGSFSKPKGVAVDSQGEVYVVDGIYDTVQIFNRRGDLLMNFGKSGEKEGDFWLPAGIAVDGKGRIFVADTYNQRVQVFRFLGPPKAEAVLAPSVDMNK